MRFSACIEMLYSNMEFYDRFNAAKQNGFDTVEFWKWSNKDIDGIKQKMIENNLSCSVFNIDSRNSKLSDDLSHGVLNSGRKNDLIRPVIANVDKAFLVFSVKEPELNLNLLDRMIAIIEYNNIIYISMPLPSI